MEEKNEECEGNKKEANNEDVENNEEEKEETWEDDKMEVGDACGVGRHELIDK